MTRLVLKKIGVLSLAKIYTILMAIIGLVIGIVYAIIGLVISATTTEPGIGAGIGLVGIIITPVVYAIIGFISGAVGAWLYNLIARWIGGVELEFGK